MSNSVSACCHALIRVVSAPSESFLFCHKCGEACRVKGEAMSEKGITDPSIAENLVKLQKQISNMADEMLEYQIDFVFMALDNAVKHDLFSKTYIDKDEEKTLRIPLALHVREAAKAEIMKHRPALVALAEQIVTRRILKLLADRGE